MQPPRRFSRITCIQHRLRSDRVHVYTVESGPRLTSPAQSIPRRGHAEQLKIFPAVLLAFSVLASLANLCAISAKTRNPNLHAATTNHEPQLAQHCRACCRAVCAPRPPRGPAAACLVWNFLYAHASLQILLYTWNAPPIGERDSARFAPARARLSSASTVSIVAAHRPAQGSQPSML